MSALGIIFPDQLSKNNKVYEILKSSDDLLLYEPIESFYKHNHHKQKSKREQNSNCTILNDR
jgi:deoxyribodipyrimidine photolyase-like uncharacterized protein